MLYSFGAGTGVSYEQLQQRRKIVDALQKQNTRTPRNAGEGVHAIARALVARGVDRQNTEAAEKMRQQYSGLWDGLLGATGGGSYMGSGATGQSAGTFSAQPQSTQERMGLDMGRTPEEQTAAQNPSETVGGVSYDMGTPAGNPGMKSFRDAIASIESAGSGDYSAVGPTNAKLGRALGRYQIMEANIGPWSREVLGREVTPQEFMANPNLQDAIFDGKFGQYVQQFGPEGAAQAWFAGPGGVGKTGRKDVLGTSVGQYGRKFRQALGGGSQGVQTAQAGQKAVAQALLNQKLTQSQPMTPLEQQQFQMNQMEMERMGQQAPDVVDINGVDATWDAQQGRYVPVEGFEAQPEFSMLSPQEVQQLGLPEGAYQRGADGKVYQVGGGGTNVTVNNGGGKFAEEFAKTDAQALAAVSESGLAAQRNLGRIDQLESLLSESPSGFGALAKQYAGEWGIKTEGLEDIQAATALINSLVPGQRQPGSGPMSDADLALFKQSLPRIINQPGGNETIIRTMRGIAQYDAEGAAIVQDLRAGKLTRAEAFDKLRNRANPLEGFEAPKGNKDQVSSDNPYIGLSSEDFKKIDLDTLTFEQLQQLDEARKAQRGQ